MEWNRGPRLRAALMSGVLLAATAKSPSASAGPTPTPTKTSTASQGWSRHNPAAAEAAASGKPVVIEVFVPLCSEKRGGPCGKHDGAGDPADLENNIYWGAIYGARRYLERSWLGWKRVEQSSGDGSFEIERAVFKRTVPGSRWGVSQPVDVIAVLHAVHGDSNELALERFRDAASGGATVKFNDGDGLREEGVHVVGFMGRNPLLKNGKPPREKDLDLADPGGSGSGLPSFSISAHSRETLGTWLHKAGSPALVLARGAVASEGYLLESVLTSLAENQPGWVIRKRASQTYAKQHKMMKSVAEIHFSPTLPKSYLRRY